MRASSIFTLIVSSLVISACSDAAKDTHPKQLVSQRQAIFKKMTKTLEPMGLVARERQDFVKAEFMASALALQELSRQPWVFFSADGNYPPSRTKPEAWSQAAEFKQAQDVYLAKVDQLVRVSDGVDMNALRTAVDAVQKSCKACHEQFRSESR